jgi:hypothetical protein
MIDGGQEARDLMPTRRDCARDGEGTDMATGNLLDITLVVLIFAFGNYLWRLAIKRQDERRERIAKERERLAEERRDANIARAIAAFPGHWTRDHILTKRHWPRLFDLYPPDVVVRCDEGDDIGLFKASRVRAIEKSNEELKDIRVSRSRTIRWKRRDAQERKQAELAREAYLRARLSEQISVHIDELPDIERKERQ